MNQKLAAIFVVSFALLAWGQTKVDQGKPGNQGSWPVTMGAPVYPSDGGVSSAVGTFPYHCANSSPNTKVWMDGGAQTIGSATSRIYTIVTNNGDDLGAGTGIVKCRSDGTNPTLVAGTPGANLGVGVSVSYTNTSGAPISCIGTSLWVGGFECAP